MAEMISDIVADYIWEKGWWGYVFALTLLVLAAVFAIRALKSRREQYDDLPVEQRPRRRRRRPFLAGIRSLFRRFRHSVHVSPDLPGLLALDPGFDEAQFLATAEALFGRLARAAAAGDLSPMKAEIAPTIYRLWSDPEFLPQWLPGTWTVDSAKLLRWSFEGTTLRVETALSAQRSVPAEIRPATLELTLTREQLPQADGKDRLCPRCGASASLKSARCPACGASLSGLNWRPWQIFGVKPLS